MTRSSCRNVLPRAHFVDIYRLTIAATFGDAHWRARRRRCSEFEAGLFGSQCVGRVVRRIDHVRSPSLSLATKHTNRSKRAARDTRASNAISTRGLRAQEQKRVITMEM